MNKPILPTKSTCAVEEKRCEHRCLIGSICKNNFSRLLYQVPINDVVNEHTCTVSKLYIFIILKSLVQKFGMGLPKIKALCRLSSLVEAIESHLLLFSSSFQTLPMFLVSWLPFTLFRVIKLYLSLPLFSSHPSLQLSSSAFVFHF